MKQLKYGIIYHARYDRGEPLFFTSFFLQGFLHVGAQDPSQKMISRKNKKSYRMDENSQGLGTRRDSSCKTKWPIIFFFSDDIGLRSPVIHKPFSPKKGIPL